MTSEKDVYRPERVQIHWVQVHRYLNHVEEKERLLLHQLLKGLLTLAYLQCLQEPMTINLDKNLLAVTTEQDG